MAASLRRGQVELTDTIFAVSSGRPPAGVAVIRVSGSAAFAAGRALAGTLPQPRYTALRTLRANDLILDRALVLCFAGPASATGEDVVEFHCHGGRAVVAAVEGALARQPGLRRAEPGEFTRRALINGRIDLMQAEGLADLLEAETESQRIAAIAAAEGRLSERTRRWMDIVSDLSARVEALLDYAEEGDVGDEVRAAEQIATDMAGLRQEMLSALAAPSVERLRAGVRVVIAGPPNAGKSTLLNHLVGRDAAIVSPIAGTTRDRVEATVSRAGLPLLLIDTAGLTETADAIEAIGVERASEAIDTADVLLWLGDDEPPRREAIRVHPRSDLPERRTSPATADVSVSCHTGEGTATLWSLISARAGNILHDADDVVPLHEHQRQTIHMAASTLEETPRELLLTAEALAQVRRLLARLLGVDATEAMLDVLFGRFCLGK